MIEGAVVVTMVVGDTKSIPHSLLAVNGFFSLTGMDGGRLLLRRGGPCTDCISFFVGGQGNSFLEVTTAFFGGLLAPAPTPNNSTGGRNVDYCYSSES